jgi:hypothetical protein
MAKSKYRSLVVTVALFGGALFITSTIASVLDVIMRRKTPVVVETYVPPSSPVKVTPFTAGSRSQLRDRLNPPQTILIPGSPDAA